MSTTSNPPASPLHLGQMAVVLLLLLALSCPLRGQHALGENLRSADELYAYACGLYERKFYDMALPEFVRFLERFPDDKRSEDAAYQCICCLYQLGDMKAALPLIEDYRKKHPRGRISDYLGNLQGSIYFSRKDYARSAEAYKSLLDCKTDGLAEEAQYLYAKCLLELGQNEQAAAVFKKLGELPLESASPFRFHGAMAYANALYQTGHYPEAMEYYRRIKDAPKSPDNDLAEQAFYRFAQICSYLGKKKEAMEAFEALLLRFPDGRLAKETRKGRILLYSDLDNHARVIEHSAQWRKLYPRDVDSEIDYAQARAYMNQKAFNEAVSLFQRVQLDTQAPQVVRQNASFCAAYCLAEARLHAAAEQAALNYLDSYPRSTNAGEMLLVLARSQVAQQKQEAAIESYKKACNAFAEDPGRLLAVQEELVEVYRALKRLPEAAALLERMAGGAEAVQKGKNAMSLLYLAGHCRKEAQQKQGAVADFQKVAEGPDRSLAREALKQLEGIHRQDEDFGKAIACLEKLKQDATAAEVPLLDYFIALNAFCKQDTASAIVLLEQNLARKDMDGDLRLECQLLLARACLSAGNQKKALAALDGSFAAPPEKLKGKLDAAFLMAAAEAYVGARRLDGARDAYQRVCALQGVSSAQAAEARLKMVSQVLFPLKNYAEGEKILEELLVLCKKDSGLESIQAELYSLLAEHQMMMGKWEQALASAERALVLEPADAQTAARSLYVLANVRLTVEKRPEEANRNATMCFINYADPVYSPLAMALSVQAFRMLKQPRKADTVLKELKAKYPAWANEHPELAR